MQQQQPKQKPVYRARAKEQQFVLTSSSFFASFFSPSAAAAQSGLKRNQRTVIHVQLLCGLTGPMSTPKKVKEAVAAQQQRSLS